MTKLMPVCLGLSALLTLSGRSALAQIIPDASLGLESSVVDPVLVDGIPVQVIEGGATRGGNLFHSFETFSVPSQTAVFFNNSPDIDRIISRVTGSSGSLIDGMVTANGAADLFLVNPNGILFGPDAQLSLGGSFVASTAEGLVFEDGYQFGTVDPGIPPLLTVNVPIGLQMGSNPGDLGVLGSTLSVAAGQTLALVGGDVRLEAGSGLLAESGRLEVGSVMEAGVLGLNPDTLRVDYQSVQELGRLDIEAGSLLAVSGSPGGSIQLQAAQITSQNASITSRTEGELDGGDIQLKASESIAISNGQSETGISNVASQGSGTGGDISLQAPLILLDQANVFVFALGEGDAGQIAVIADHLELLQGSQLSADALQGSGDAGDILIQAGDILIDSGSQAEILSGVSTLSGLESTGNSGSIRIEANRLTLDRQGQISATTQSSGDAGNITLTVDSLILRAGGSISTNTGGSGAGGQIMINAAEGVEVSGSSDPLFLPEFDLEVELPSRISAESLVTDFEEGSFIPATGAGGRIQITTPQLMVADQGLITTGTNGPGAAGSIQIQADQVFLNQGGSIESGTTLGSGAGGNITLTVGSLHIGESGSLNVITLADGVGGSIDIQANRVDLAAGGQIQASTGQGSGAGGQITLQVTERLLIQGQDPDMGFPSAIAAIALGSGQGGDVDIRASQTQVKDGGIISVSSLSEDPRSGAGSLTLNGNTVLLDNGSLAAATGSGDQGNIVVDTDTLILPNQGSITTDASGTATGGNITLQTEVLAALEESEIVARAIEGQGGNITITAAGIFLSPDSLVSAASELGIDGVVDIVTPNLDPGAGLVDLPDQVTDLGDLVATLCQQDQQTSSFVVVGRTGIPSSPSDLAQDPVVWQDLRILTQSFPVSLNPDPSQASWYALRIPCATN